MIGHATLLFLFLAGIIRLYPSARLISFDLFRYSRLYISLIATGTLYNLGVWADKFIFWFNPSTSDQVIGPLRSSLLYDLPIFLAYLAIIPGMAVFLVKIETNFAEWYDNYFNAIRDGGSLNDIESARHEMIAATREGLLAICKIQAITIAALLIFAPKLLTWLGISHYHLPLFYIDVVGVSIQVVFMALLNIFFYLDKRKIVVRLCLVFLILNVLLTLLSQHLGPLYFGYGFTLSLLICVLIALYQLSNTFRTLTYNTFVLRTN